MRALPSQSVMTCRTAIGRPVQAAHRSLVTCHSPAVRPPSHPCRAPCSALVAPRPSDARRRGDAHQPDCSPQHPTV
ncbi:hypothetical protein [Burkholderia thailandensis]|uniref:hypothetical protein n=1 Tax=Burkholderia thailandensis TaxID=57975 RepID=UPI003F68A9CF